MSPLKYLFLYLTFDCNMNCRHCWVYGGSAKTKPLDTKVWTNAVDQAADLGLQLVKFTGGEPVLEKSLLFDLIETGVEYTIETNGTLFTEHDIMRISKTNIVEIDVSMDFPDAKRFEAFRGLSHSFEKVTHTIRLLHEYGIPVVCVMSVFKDNLKEVPAVADLVFDLGACKFKAHPVLSMGKAKQFSRYLPLNAYREFVQVLERMDKKYPGKIGTFLPWALIAGFMSNPLTITRSVCEYKSLLTLLPNGDISLCGIGIINPSTVIGNIKYTTLSEIWENESSLLADLHSMNPLQLEGICKRCIFKNYCANMCPAFVYDVYGKFAASYPICEELEASGLFPEKYLV